MKKTGLHKATLYLCLERLMEKGLTHFAYVEKTRVFQAAAPERLIENLKETEESLSHVLPELKKHVSPSEPHAAIYVGYTGIKTVCDEILERLKPKGEYTDFGVSGLFRKVMGSYWDVWQAKKRRYQIRSRVIFEDTVRKKNPKLLKDYVGEARFVPARYHCPSDTFVYEDRVVVCVWTAQPPFAVVMQNKDTAQGYKNIFEWMWKKAKR